MLEKIKELRQRTNLGMTDCKKALEEANGDLEQAIVILQKRGLKKVDDLVLALEGQVLARVRNNEGVIIEVNCQTDFAARSDNFNQFINKLVNNPSLLHEPDEQVKLETERVNHSNQLGEKIVIRRFSISHPWEGRISAAYTHLGGKIAALVDAKATMADTPFLENVAMHIAAAKPLAINRKDLHPNWVTKNQSLFEEEVKNKPGAIRAKIVAGKMEKAYAEVCLMEQEAVWEPKKTIKDLCPEGVEIERFERFERGEQI